MRYAVIGCVVLAIGIAYFYLGHDDGAPNSAAVITNIELTDDQIVRDLPESDDIGSSVRVVEPRTTPDMDGGAMPEHGNAERPSNFVSEMKARIDSLQRGFARAPYESARIVDAYMAQVAMGDEWSDAVSADLDAWISRELGPPLDQQVLVKCVIDVCAIDVFTTTKVFLQEFNPAYAQWHRENTQWSQMPSFYVPDDQGYYRYYYFKDSFDFAELR